MNLLNKIKKGVIHVGGNTGQASESYGDLNVLWVEPIPNVFKQLQDNIKPYPSQKALNYLISDTDNKEYNLYVSNQSARSSFLPFTNHHFNDSRFRHTETLTLRSIRMDTLIKKHEINLNDYDALVTDCQGADYFILNSFGELINHFSYIKSEVMISEIYEGLVKEEYINKFLKSKGFDLISDLPYVIKNTQRDNIYKNQH
jgi:FkbM family methyltransferase